MRKNTTFLLAATMLAANISFAVPAFADSLQTYNLDTMVVTAQRESKRDVDTPASVTTVSQKQLVETGAANLFDALRLQRFLWRQPVPWRYERKNPDARCE